MNRVLAISLDGFEPSIADEMMAAGQLPALAALRGRSARFLLEHGAAVRTGLGAEHLSSGMSPEDSGRWSAVHFDKDNYRAVQEGPKFAPFPARMSAKTVVFDLPYFDLEQAPDVMGISAWGAHDAGTGFMGNPAGVDAQFLARCGAYPATDSIYAFAWPSAEKCRVVETELVQGVDARAKAASWLLEERFPGWDLAIIGVSEAHSALEALWHGHDAQHPLHSHPSASAAGLGVRNVYAAIDRLIGRLGSAFADATIVVFSIHGMGPNAADVPSMVLLPELLHRYEFGRPFFEQPANWALAADGIPLLRESEKWHAGSSGRDQWRTLRNRVAPLVPNLVKTQLKRALQPPSEPPGGERERSVQWMPAAQMHAVWPRMRAFALPSFYDGRIRINLKGRERKGRVTLDQYPVLCEEITRLLGECRNPRTGDSVVDSIEFGRADLPLALGSTAADIAIVWKGLTLALEHPAIGTIGPVPFRRTGGHTGPFGLAYIAGDRFAPNDYGTRSSFDIVPTLFDLLGEALPPGISGQSLLPALVPTANAAGGPRAS